LIPCADPHALSFWNLSEAFVLAAIRQQHGVSMKNVRKALRYVERELGIERPLISVRLKTDGVDLFVERWDKLVNARKSQVAIREALEARLERIDFDTHGIVRRLYPPTRPEEPSTRRSIEIDPTRGFGRALLAGTSIVLQVVLDRFRAGEATNELARDYEVEPALIEDAIRSELIPAA
jgi:uncharacterized protein (DUF433 family)